MTRPEHTDLSTVDRRRFLRGSAVALALPWLESMAAAWPASGAKEKRRRLACVYFPDGVPMPLAEDPAYEDWSWFPHGSGKDFRFTKCFEPLAPLREEALGSEAQRAFAWACYEAGLFLFPDE